MTRTIRGRRRIPITRRCVFQDWILMNRLFQSNCLHSFLQAEKRAHHNALERKRRDHIKDSFTNLREAVPSLQGEKVNSVFMRVRHTHGSTNTQSVLQASRAQILKKAAEYISAMRRKSSIQSNDIEDLKRQNSNIENQSR